MDKQEDNIEESVKETKTVSVWIGCDSDQGPVAGSGEQGHTVYLYMSSNFSF